MKINKNDFSGTGSVFRFTFARLFRNKANIVSMLILFLFALLSIPLMGIFTDVSAEPNEPEKIYSSVENVYILNETELEIKPEDVRGGYWEKTEFTEAKEAPVLSEFDALAVFSYGENGISIDVSAAQESAVDQMDLFSLSAEMENLYFSALTESMGVSQEQLDIINYGYSVETQSQKEHFEAETEFSESGFVVQYAYSIIILMLCTYSSTYIIRAVLEEKASKLVELLMVSVKPLALIAGKILAVMAFMFIQMAGLFACFGISWAISGFFFDTAAIEEIFVNIDLDFLAGGIGIGDAAVIFVSMALAYLTVSIISGISGACCNSMEEADSAATTSMILVLGGYIVSCVVGAVPNQPLAVISSIVPVISVFCAPVQYLSGNIGIGIMLISFAVQAAVVALLFVLCAKVYSALIIHSGSRLKIKDVFAIVKTEAKGAKENV